MSPSENLYRLGPFGDGPRVAGFLDRVIRSNLSLPGPARIALAPGALRVAGLWLSLMGYTLTSDSSGLERDVLVTGGADPALKGVAGLTRGGLVIVMLPGQDLIHHLWSEAQDHGLDFLEAYGFIDGDPITPSSDPAILVFAKTRP